jgi:hypothetical protein
VAAPGRAKTGELFDRVDLTAETLDGLDDILPRVLADVFADHACLLTKGSRGPDDGIQAMTQTDGVVEGSTPPPLREHNIAAEEGTRRAMRPTQGVSIPRSGHGAVCQVARRYFGGTWVYCDAFYVKDDEGYVKDDEGRSRVCGCKSVPCVNPARTFSKLHDFGLLLNPGVPILRSERYFIQYRSPMRAIVSNYLLHVVVFPDECGYRGWQSYAMFEVGYWKRFVEKWVLDFPVSDVPPLYCSYESLLSEPQARMREILTFMSEEPLEDEAVTRIIEQLPKVEPRDRLAEFRYFDPVFFRELEAVASGYMETLGLPSFEDGV